MVTLQDAYYHLGIDYYDDTMTAANVQRALNAATKRMEGAVGADARQYLPDDDRIDQLVLLYTAENYDARNAACNASAKESNAHRRLTADLELQIKLELRRAKEAAGVSV